jgi:hypothetical protein
MDDTPYINDGADASLRKTVSLLNKIEAKTGSTTITGPVTVSNEVEVTNSTGNPIPVSGTVGLDSTSLSALENISVTFPATQNVNVTNAGLNVSVSNLPATQPVTGTFWPTTQPVSGSVSVSNFPATQAVSLASVPSHAVTGSGSFTAAQTTAANLNATVVGSGSFTAAQATASNLKAQAQLLNSAGTVVDYAMTGVAGTPATDVVSVQGISGGTVIPVSLASVPSHAVTGPLTNTELRLTAVPVSGTFFQGTQPVSLASVPSHPVTGTFWQATQPVSIASAPVTPVTDNGGSLTIDGTVTSRLADGTGNNLTSVARGSERALSVQIVDASGAQVTTFGGGGGGGTVTATQTTPSALKAQAQILDATGSQMSFVNAGVAGTPSVDVLTVQGSTSGTPIPVRVAAYSGGSSVSFSSFTSTTSLAFVGVDSNRKVLTIFNEGNGTLYIKPAAYSGDVVSITNYQIRMSPGDYWEVPAAQLGLQHLGIFASVGTARITSIS